MVIILEIQLDQLIEKFMVNKRRIIFNILNSSCEKFGINKKTD